MKIETLGSSPGSERFRSDRRQLAGLLMIMGMCVTFQPLSGIATLIGVKQNANETSFGTQWLIFCGSIQIIFGTLAMVVGYLSLVHDYGNYRLTGTLIILTQLSWIPFLTGIIRVGIAITPPYSINPFVPEDYMPSQNDAIFLGSIGILGLMSHGVGFFGGLSFLGFALYTFDVGKPTQRDAKYYRGRLLFYSFVMLIAGMSQILLGAYILFEFGGGQLSPPIEVTIYRVSFPEISVAMGSVQMIVGYYGVGNYLHLFPVGPSNNTFQILALISWLLQIIFQYIVQIGYSDLDDTAALTSLALYGFGINIIPPFLDYKMRTAPISFNEDYYTHLNRDDKIATPEIPAPSEIDETASFVENLTSLKVENGSKMHLNIIRKNPDDKEEKGGQSNDDSSKHAKSKRNIETSGNPTRRPLKGFFSRLFSNSKALVLEKREHLKSNHINQVNEIEAIDCALIEALKTNDESDVASEKIIGDQKSLIDVSMATTEPRSDSMIVVKESVEHSRGPEYSNEYGISVEERVVHPDKSDVPMDHTVEHSPEPGIIVEEYVEHYDEISQEDLFTLNTREEIEDDENGNDHDTPPRSNESFSTDMKDTWGDQSGQDALLSPIEEENSNRIATEEQIVKNDPSSNREIAVRSHYFDEEKSLPKNHSTSKRFMNSSSSKIHPHTSDSYYDYDSDEGFEISEATPDDDTAQLDAKIDKLKGELLSDINLESYLNQIL